MNKVFACVTLAAGWLAVQGQPQTVPSPTAVPEKGNVCAMQRDPVAYDRKLIDVSGLVSHGFENFALTDVECAQVAGGVWLEYGGSVNSDTIYCCGPAAGAKRAATLIVEGLTIPLIEDALFRRFDARIRGRRDTRFRARLIGRFFAGEQIETPSGRFWGGYGHLGCCSLLVIQQVVSIDGGPVSKLPLTLP